MAEEFCDVGRGITLCYETFGDPSDPTVLLIMGLSSQMIVWDDEFCEKIAAAGHHVVRFDNRDIGRSTQMSFRPPSVGQLLRRRFPPEQYTLSDMAADTVGLLDCLEIESVHLVGASMGGMIAQTIAIEHPQRVRSLVSMMSNTGSRRSGQPGLRVYGHFLRRMPRDRDAAIAHMVGLFKVVGSRGDLQDLEEIRRLVGRSYDRAFNPAGGARQLAAILKSGSRSHLLGGIKVPTMIIHGTADRLISPSGGRATAAAIPGAELIMINDMGHDLPRSLWPRLTGAIAECARRGERSAATLG